MSKHLLSALLFLPLLASLAALLIPRHKASAFRYLSLFVSALQAVILVLTLIAYHYQTGTYRLIEHTSWFSLQLGSWGHLQADYFLAVDGLSMPLVALTVIIMFIATISSWNINKNQKGYFVLLLILNGTLIGCFTALDLLLFYLFFEFVLLPMFFLIGIWGGPRREYASIKFFLYTLVGSILILIVFIGLYISAASPADKVTHTFNLVYLIDPGNYIPGSILHPANALTFWGLSVRWWAFLLLFVGFGIKLPMVPFHTWLPDAHVEAPTPISVILAALLLKLGGYGLMRIAYPIFSDAALYSSTLVGAVGVVSILYGALNAMASKDLKRLIAYSSVSHMGFVLLGLASVTVEGVTGAAYQMFSHGILTTILFLLAGVLYDRTHNRMIENYSGLVSKMPAFFAIVLVGFFASLGLPGLSGFIAELMVFLGAFRSNSVNGLLHESFAVVSTLGLVLTAAYYLWTIQRMFFGPFFVKGNVHEAQLTDLDKREYSMLIPLCVVAVLFGILPQLLLDYINPFANDFVDFVLTTGRRLTLNP